ncbi:MAG: two-component system sensor histidine kinase NtrB [Candidatus Omnitrophota bacterium]
MEKRETQEPLETYHALYEAANDAIFLIENTIFVDCNKKTLHVFGFDDKNEIIGNHPWNVSLSPEIQPDGQPSIEKAQKIIELVFKGEPQRFYWRHIRKDKTPFDADISLSRLELRDRVYLLAILRDVTERMRMEEMLIQSEKMISIGGLAAGMAHEINNPLAGILQNTQVIMHRLDPKFSKNRQVAAECQTTMETITTYMEKRNIRSMLESVFESGVRATRIVENVLSFSRKGESQFEAHDLRTLMEQTIELASNEYNFKTKYDFRSIAIRREYRCDVPDVLCNPSKIQQVFLNILKNGAHAMLEDKEIRKSRKRSSREPEFIIRIFYEKKSEMVRIEIEDNGPGMSESIRKRIFEPFFTTKEIGMGTGLGLSMSYFIITQNHQGTLEVESEPGKGSNFIIRLPAHKK